MLNGVGALAVQTHLLHELVAVRFMAAVVGALVEL
jgi:hypothetical protein